ncbi:hypothetical protein ACFRMO_08285 [Streptomyces anulatus]|uniref:hypothetical protein n=1 Tax=Streptomyces anulatus TaxID=1892 RepID=UPI003679FC7F
MSKLKNRCWTLVQHSAYTARQDPTFKNAVESASLSTHQELGQVVDAGALLFTSYADAEDAADEISKDALDRALYPEQVSADTPTGPLTFAESLTIGGRPLFLPPAPPNS